MREIDATSHTHPASSDGRTSAEGEVEEGGGGGCGSGSRGGGGGGGGGDGGRRGGGGGREDERRRGRARSAMRRPARSREE